MLQVSMIPPIDVLHEIMTRKRQIIKHYHGLRSVFSPSNGQGMMGEHGLGGACSHI